MCHLKNVIIRHKPQKKCSLNANGPTRNHLTSLLLLLKRSVLIRKKQQDAPADSGNVLIRGQISIKQLCVTCLGQTHKPMKCDVVYTTYGQATIDLTWIIIRS